MSLPLWLWLPVHSEDDLQAGGINACMQGISPLQFAFHCLWNNVLQNCHDWRTLLSSKQKGELLTCTHSRELPGGPCPSASKRLGRGRARKGLSTPQPGPEAGMHTCGAAPSTFRGEAGGPCGPGLFLQTPLPLVLFLSWLVPRPCQDPAERVLWVQAAGAC